MSAAIATSDLIQTCRRVATSSRAGIDARRTWEMETNKGDADRRRVMAEIRRRIATGDSLADAVADSKYFPPLFVEMTRVGEQTGKIDEVLFRLADHYENLQRLQRNFWFGIAWPLAQLAFAIGVIGLVIFLPSAIGGDQVPDILGFGLKGTDGLIKYLLLVAVFGGGIVLSLYALVKGWFGDGPLIAATKIPLAGRCLETLALARLSWALSMAHESGMTAKRTVRLAFSAAHHPPYTARLDTIERKIGGGDGFYEAFSESKVFPVDFLDAVHAAEVSGTLTETMLRKTTDYDEESQRLLRLLTWIAGGVVVAVCGFIIIVMIFRLFGFYLNMLNDASKI